MVLLVKICVAFVARWPGITATDGEVQARFTRIQSNPVEQTSHTQQNTDMSGLDTTACGKQQHRSVDHKDLVYVQYVHLESKRPRETGRPTQKLRKSCFGKGRASLHILPDRDTLFT